MKTRLICILSVLALFACDSKQPSASADQPTEASSEASDDDKHEEESSDDEGDDDQAAAEEPSEDLESKSCEEFYAYSREVCLKALSDGLDVNCYKVLVKANSTRKIMAGEGAMAKRTKDLSEEQKVKSFCGRPYAKLAEKVAEADTETVEHPPGCKEAIEVIDEHCLKPMAAGKAYKSGCGSALQTVSRWKSGEKFCTLSKDMVLN